MDHGGTGGSAPDEAVRLPAIIVADDDVATVTFLSRFLDRMGLANPVLTATSGAEAVVRLEDLTADPPALVLLDVHMPGSSGLDVLRWMREHPIHVEVPVVMLTGSAELDDVNDAYGLGIVSYLVKPIGFDALEDVLRALSGPWALLNHRWHGDGSAR